MDLTGRVSMKNGGFGTDTLRCTNRTRWHVHQRTYTYVCSGLHSPCL